MPAKCAVCRARSAIADKYRRRNALGTSAAGARELNWEGCDFDDLRWSAISARLRGLTRAAELHVSLLQIRASGHGTIKPVFGSFAALRIAGLGARRALKPPEITSPFFNNIGQNEKVSPRFFCLIRNLAPLPLSSVACGLLPKRSPPSSELGASHSCASAPITSGPSRRRTKGPPRPQPWRNSISMKSSASG
jgi:hypothetical protein